MLERILAVRLSLCGRQREIVAGVLVDGEELNSGRAELLRFRLCQAPLRMNHAVVAADRRNALGAQHVDRFRAVAVGVNDRHRPLLG